MHTWTIRCNEPLVRLNCYFSINFLAHVNIIVLINFYEIEKSYEKKIETLLIWFCKNIFPHCSFDEWSKKRNKNINFFTFNKLVWLQKKFYCKTMISQYPSIPVYLHQTTPIIKKSYRSPYHIVSPKNQIRPQPLFTCIDEIYSYDSVPSSLLQQSKHKSAMSDTKSKENKKKKYQSYSITIIVIIIILCIIVITVLLAVFLSYQTKT